MPEATRNMVLNPSAEIAGNFAAVGGPVGASRAWSISKFGRVYYSLNTVGDNQGISFTLSTLTAQDHYVTLYADFTTKTADWDWSLDNINYHEPTAIMVITSGLDFGNYTLYGYLFDAAEANGSTTLYVRQNGAAGVLAVRIDGIQVETLGYWTTYCDGDQEGCQWDGTPHASTSRRASVSRAGGRMRDFQDDYDFNIEAMLGPGSVPHNLRIDPFALLPGGELNSDKLPSRTFTLTGTIDEDSWAAYHSTRADLIAVLGPQAYPEDNRGPQEIRIWYTGAPIVKEISAAFERGLDLRLSAKRDPCLFERNIGLQFKAADPLWYEIGNSARLLDANDNQIVRYMAGRPYSVGNHGIWDNMSVDAITNPVAVYAMVVGPDNRVYVGGDFDLLDGVANTVNIAVYDPLADTWSALGAGLNNIVRGLAFGPDGTLYAVGDFTLAGGLAAGDYVAQFKHVFEIPDFTNLLLNPGFETGGTGGNFNGGAEIDDGISDVFDNWTATGVNDPAGDKCEATATVHGGSVALKFTYTTAQVYIRTATVDYMTAVPGADYELSFWTRGDGAVGGRYALYDISNGAWIIGVTATGVIGVVYTEITARFTAPAGCTLMSLYFYSSSVAGVCYFDDAEIFATWSAVGDPDSGGATMNNVNCVTIDDNGNVFVGGDFTLIDGVANASYTAYWDGVTWNALQALVLSWSGGAPEVFCMALAPNGDIYIGGRFTRHTVNNDVNYILRYDGTAYNMLGSSAGLTGNGTDDTVYAIDVDRSGQVFLGGVFTACMNDTIARIAKWNGAAFEAMGNGVDAAVRALAFGPDGVLWVGGAFGTMTDLGWVDRLARWKDSSWSSVDINLPGAPTVYAIAVGVVDPVLVQNYDVWIGFDTTGTAYFSGDQLITHSWQTGGWLSYPKFAIERTGGTGAQMILLKNTSNGYELNFDYALRDGERLSVDLTPTRKSIASSFYGEVPAAVLPNSDFGRFALLSSTNATGQILVFADLVGAPSMEAWFEYRKAYESID